MGLFNFFKKKKKNSVSQSSSDANTANGQKMKSTTVVDLDEKPASGKK